MAKPAIGLSREKQMEALAVMAGRLRHLRGEVGNGRLRIRGARWHEEGEQGPGFLERTTLVFEVEWTKEG